MNIEDKLKSLKKDYENITPTFYLKMYGEKDLLTNIENQHSAKKMVKTLSFAFICLVLLFLASFQIYKDVQAAQPGNPLYQVKVFSEKILNKNNGNNSPGGKDKPNETERTINENPSEKPENDEGSILPSPKIRIRSEDDGEVDGANSENNIEKPEDTIHPQSTETPETHNEE